MCNSSSDNAVMPHVIANNSDARVVNPVTVAAERPVNAKGIVQCITHL